MAALILDNRHYTMRAKTINARMYRIDHVDQLYYQLDANTLLGRQIPIAVVAFRPERMAPINALMEAMPPRLRERLLVEYLGMLFTPERSADAERT